MSKPFGQICLGCGSTMSDEHLLMEKQFRPNLISCCPDRKMVDVYTHPVKQLSDEDIEEKIDNCFGVHAFNLDTEWTLEQVREYGLQLARAIIKEITE